MVFRQVIDENVKKKKNHFTANISIYTGQRHFEVLRSFILHIT